MLARAWPVAKTVRRPMQERQLLTHVLIRDLFFSEAIFDQPFKFTHHRVLAGLVWIVCAALLVGRWCLGWYGQ